MNAKEDNIYIQCTNRLTPKTGPEIRCEKEKGHSHKVSKNPTNQLHKAQVYSNDSPQDGSYIKHITTTYIW